MKVIKSAKTVASLRKLLSIDREYASLKQGRNNVKNGVYSLLTCHTRRECSVETSCNSVKVKFGIKVMELVVKFRIKVSFYSLSTFRSSTKVKYGIKVKSPENQGRFLDFLSHRSESMRFQKLDGTRYPEVSAFPISMQHMS